MKFHKAPWITCSAAGLAVICSGCMHHRNYPNPSAFEPNRSFDSNERALDRSAVPAATSSSRVRLAGQGGGATESSQVVQTTFDAGGSNESVIVAHSLSGFTTGEPTPLTDSLAGGATLDQLLSMAFANNPAIKELAATTQIAAGYRTQVGLYANPLLGYQGQQLADAGTDQHVVFLQQQIITGGKLELNRAVLNEAVRAQLQELEAAKAPRRNGHQVGLL